VSTDTPDIAPDWEQNVRIVLARVGRLALDAHTLGPDDLLVDAGLTSQATVEVIFSLEDEYGCEIDDSLITRENLATIARMAPMFAQAVRM
jgi:acyl carrier protein